MVLEWVYMASELGTQTRGPQDVLWIEGCYFSRACLRPFATGGWSGDDMSHGHEETLCKELAGCLAWLFGLT